MNILFYDKDFGPGGIAVVSETLASALQQRGYNTAIYVLSLPHKDLLSRLPKTVPMIVGQGIKYSKRNVEQLRQVLIERRIDVVVNQQGLNPIPIRVLDKAKKGLKVKVISVYHMQVNTNGRLISVQQEIERCNHKFMLPLLHLKMKLFKWITAKSMRFVYNKSDIYEVLSPSFVPLFSEFTGIKDPKKLRVQTNPVTIQLPQSPVNISTKEKIILFVGRLEPEIKKPQRILDMWKLLHKQFSNWSLIMVGDGPDKVRLNKEIIDKRIPNVKLEGFQNPKPYYQRASILLLTSETEGFPLVLAEAMSYGVVPCVYDSFPASSDIVENGKNGILIPKVNDTFDVQKSAELVSSIMKDDMKLRDMSEKAIATANSYSVEKISKDWEMTFSTLVRGRLSEN
jgi:glycosyltransferase involved in cell wall biosynthesis